MKNRSDNLIVTMGTSIKEKIDIELETMFLKIVIFVSINNLIVGSLIYMVR